MLALDGELFTTGRSEFFDNWRELPERTSKIILKIRLQGYETFALLDSGAAWSVLDAETAEAIGVDDSDGDPAELSTRRGTIPGKLVSAPVVLLAEEGEDLEVNATFFVSAEWPPGRVFLGYSGFLERIRFALDPQANHFYFGPAGDLG